MLLLKNRILFPANISHSTWCHRAKNYGELQKENEQNVESDLHVILTIIASILYIPVVYIFYYENKFGDAALVARTF